MNLNDKSLSGSIVLVKGTHFLSKQIMMHMDIYARMTGRKPLRYSHAETLLWVPHLKKMHTVGARGKGTEVSPADLYYQGKEILILKPKKELTDAESWKLWEYVDIIRNAKYQTGNFLSWITYMKIGWWISAKGTKRAYCYETAARFADATHRWPEGKSLDMVSIYDLYENANYEVIKP